MHKKKPQLLRTLPFERWLHEGALVLATVPQFSPWPSIVLQDPETRQFWRYNNKNQPEIYIVFLEWWEENDITDGWVSVASLQEYTGSQDATVKKPRQKDKDDLIKAINFADRLLKLSLNGRKEAVDDKYKKAPDSLVYVNGALVLAKVTYQVWPSLVCEDPVSGKWWRYVDENEDEYEVHVIFLEWIHENTVARQWLKPSMVSQYQSKTEDKNVQKKSEDDLRKAFSFANFLSILPVKERLKKASVKYALNPLAKVQSQEEGTSTLSEDKNQNVMKRKLSDKPILEERGCDKQNKVDLQSYKLLKVSPKDRKKDLINILEKAPDSTKHYNGALVLAKVPFYPAWPSLICEDPDTGKWWRFLGRGDDKYEVYVIFLEWFYEGAVTYQWLKASKVAEYHGRDNATGNRPPKKYIKCEDDLRKAFNFAEELNWLPGQEKLKRAYLKYSLNPLEEAELVKGSNPDNIRNVKLSDETDLGDSTDS